MFAATRHVVAVDGVSFAVPEGSVLGIVGESGCGKSTLARQILGLLKPTAGDALVHGERLFALDRKARARLIQPVFQDPFSSLNPRQTIQEIVALPLVAQGSFRQRRDRQADQRRARSRRHFPGDGRPPAVTAFGRTAPARGDRPRAGHQAEGRRLRRTDQRARCVRAGADPQPAGRAAARLQPHLHLHQPQPRRGRACGQHRCRDVSRPHRRDERDRRAVPRAAPPLHARAARQRADAGARSRHSRRRPRRHHSGPVEHPARLPLPSALPCRGRTLPPRSAEADHSATAEW